MAVAKQTEVSQYIKDWHEYIESKPKNHGKDIKLLKKLIEKLLKSKTVFYDNTDVEAFVNFCKLVKHREGRWAGLPLELSIEQKYIAACIFGFKMYDTELNMVVRYFRELVLFVARKWGKALALDTPINTPSGWRTIADIMVGDYVYDENGKPTKVINTSEVFYGHTCYKVMFEDGESIIADAEHQWTVMTKNSRRMLTRTKKSNRKLLRPDYHEGHGYFTTTTEDMARDYKRARPDGKGTEYKYRVPITKPLEYVEHGLPIPPYVLGVWLGDGTSSNNTVTCSEHDLPEMLEHIRAEGEECSAKKYKTAWRIRLGTTTYSKSEKHRPENSVLNQLKVICTLNNKHIPEIYLRASINQRRELLSGLMDTDGYVDLKTGVCEFTQKNKRVTDGISELLSSLGIKYTIEIKTPTCGGKRCDTVYRFKFFVDKTTSCFKLVRKHERLKNVLSPRMKNKSIISINPVDSVPTKCLSVDSPSHLYLAGRTNTVTHNSTFISAVADFLLMCDREPAAQVWCLATQKQQASIVYEAAKNFAIGSDALRPHVKTRRDKDNSEMLLFPAGNSYMKAGSKNSEAQDGLNPHGVVIDELHAIKNRNTYDVFSSAMGARTQPLIVIISTFGFVREGIFDSILERCQAVLQGKSSERLFPIIFKIDDNDKPENRDCWIKANPGLVEARPTMSYLEGEYQKALKDVAQLPSFLAKHLNRASSLSVIYFDLSVVDGCAIDMSIEMVQDKYAVGGADLAETTDLCCASALIPINSKLYLFQKYFIARQRIEQNSKADKMAYESFCNTNALDPLNNELLKICEGSLVKKSDVTEWFVELAEKYQVTFWKIGADRWHFDDWSEDMSMNGFPIEDKDGRGVVFPVAMGAKSLSTPMKETKSLFEDEIIQYSRHNGLFRWCTINTAAKIDPNANIQPDKAKSRGRIDGYVSFLCAYIAYMKVKDMFDEYQP